MRPYDVFFFHLKKKKIVVKIRQFFRYDTSYQLPPPLNRYQVLG